MVQSEGSSRRRTRTLQCGPARDADAAARSQTPSTKFFPHSCKSSSLSNQLLSSLYYRPPGINILKHHKQTLDALDPWIFQIPLNFSITRHKKTRGFCIIIRLKPLRVSFVILYENRVTIEMFCVLDFHVTAWGVVCTPVKICNIWKNSQFVVSLINMFQGRSRKYF